MKGNIKFIIGIFVGILLCGITVYAAKSILASDISYNNTTVKAALDDLYRMADGVTTSGEAFLATAANGLELWHNTDPYTAKFTIEDLDFSNIKSINYSYTLEIDDHRFQSVKLFSSNTYYIDIDTNVSNQSVLINGTSNPLTFEYSVSNYNTGQFIVHSYTRMNDTVVNFN